MKKNGPTTLLELAEEIYEIVIGSHEAGERGEGVIYLLRLLSCWVDNPDQLKNIPKV